MGFGFRISGGGAVWTRDQTGPDAIAHRLVTAGFALTKLEEERVHLETAFMRLTKGLVQ